ncbi:MAG: pentapeptide repeat-containing protein [Deltaproteobacteria bacterium]|nr:pentapeptide repeat-containing protein [Deltaproteobacteria bacterium]
MQWRSAGHSAPERGRLSERRLWRRGPPQRRLCGADFRNAGFGGTDFRNSGFGGADFRNVGFGGADFRNSDFGAPVFGTLASRARLWRRGLPRRGSKEAGCCGAAFRVDGVRSPDFRARPSAARAAGRRPRGLGPVRGRPWNP